jgi:hypothetical protein
MENALLQKELQQMKKKKKIFVGFVYCFKSIEINFIAGYLNLKYFLLKLIMH